MVGGWLGIFVRRLVSVGDCWRCVRSVGYWQPVSVSIYYEQLVGNVVKGVRGMCGKMERNGYIGECFVKVVDSRVDGRELALEVRGGGRCVVHRRNEIVW